MPLVTERASYHPPSVRVPDSYVNPTIPAFVPPNESWVESPFGIDGSASGGGGGNTDQSNSGRAHERGGGSSDDVEDQGDEDIA